MSVRRGCDAALDAVLVLLASWTLTYHLCLVLGLGVPAAVAIELVALVATTAVWCLPRERTRAAAAWVPQATAGTAAPATVPTGMAGATALAAVLAAVAMALGAPWLLVWVPFLVAAVLGLLVASRSLRRTAHEPGPRPRADLRPAPAARGAGGGEAAVVLVWAVALAALSSVVLRANPDDLYYVNLAQWTAANGTFPLRDVLFSDLALPMANWPPTASYDALVGTVAHLVQARAATVAYVVVPPLGTALAVLALWRLLRAWGVARVALALSAALVFLLFDGGGSYASPGNLFLTRMWQGKVLLLCVVVPLLLVHALAYVERPSRRGAARLLVTGTAAVALSTTALFLTPVLALAGALPLLVRRRWRSGLVGLGAAAAYPVAGAVATVVLGGYSADEFGQRRLYRFDPGWFGREIFVGGPVGLVALVAVLGVLLGALLVPRPAARVTTALLVLATAVTFVPGVTEIGFAAVGLGPTLWRISWGCTVAALVGVLAVEVATRLPGRRSRVVAGLLALALAAGAGAPIWGAGTSSALSAPLAWKRGESTRAVTGWILAHTEPGDVVLAPDALAITVAVTTTEVKTVAPRAYYMDPLREVDSFDYAERRVLVDWVNQEAEPSPEEVAVALRALDVQVVCLDEDDDAGAVLLDGWGWSPPHVAVDYLCWTRPSPDVGQDRQRVRYTPGDASPPVALPPMLHSAKPD